MGYIWKLVKETHFEDLKVKAMKLNLLKVGYYQLF
jgi:hypothetical protein